MTLLNGKIGIIQAIPLKKDSLLSVVFQTIVHCPTGMSNFPLRQKQPPSLFPKKVACVVFLSFRSIFTVRFFKEKSLHQHLLLIYCGCWDIIIMCRDKIIISKKILVHILLKIFFVVFEIIFWYFIEDFSGIQIDVFGVYLRWFSMENDVWVQIVLFSKNSV